MKQATASKSMRGATIIVLLVSVFTTTPADNVSRAFEFGTGTAPLRSHVRTFPVPCATEGGIAAVVKFQRLGPDGTASDVPIIVELREPDTALNVEGPLVEERSAIAKKAERHEKANDYNNRKSEIWIISEGDPQSHIPSPASSTDRAEGTTDTVLVTTEPAPTTTNEINDAAKE